jgi:phosphoribosylformylglycinamidine (FGAM) synthase-like enzyme
LLIAAAEMSFASGLGLRLDLTSLPTEGEIGVIAGCFAETPSRYVLEIERGNLDAVERALGELPWASVGEFNNSGRLTLEAAGIDVAIDELQEAWKRPLDW